MLTQPERLGHTIEVTLTFNKPVEWSVFTSLRDAVRLDPIQYTFAELDATGAKWSQDQIAVLDGVKRSDEELISAVEREAQFAGVRVLGVILVQARISVDKTTLGTLASDARVYAVDTVEADVTELVASRDMNLTALSASSIVRVWVPSPFWTLDWSAP